MTPSGTRARLPGAVQGAEALIAPVRREPVYNATPRQTIRNLDPNMYGTNSNINGGMTAGSRVGRNPIQPFQARAGRPSTLGYR
jgi:hypothetical protein